MKKINQAAFHKLYGIQKPRVVYYRRDFLDYTVMILLCATAIGFSYGFGRAMSIVGFALCALMLATFIIRHGIEWRVPVVLRRPQDALYMFVYKLQNLKPVYFLALGFLLLENLLIAATPNLPHHVAWMRTLALYLFYIHFISLTAYRTAILVDHLLKKELVREVLMQTPWKRVITARTNITLEIIHAYATGVLTHIILLAPWYLLIRYSRFSAVFLPVTCFMSVVLHVRWLKVFNSWFYRDHWLGHNSEFEYIFLHGPHHDAIPSGLIAVTENGFLEGFMRSALAKPNAFYNPLIASVIFTLDIKTNIDLHQYIPGIFPRLPRQVLEIYQHSTHHYGPLAPYGFGFKLDQAGVSEDFRKKYRLLPDEFKNSARLDEELTGFKWDNQAHRRLLTLYDKYHN